MTMTTNRDAIVKIVNGQPHRFDPLTDIDIDQAVTDGDNVALIKVEIAQLEAMPEAQGWYVQHSLKLARKRLAAAEAKAAR